MVTTTVKWNPLQPSTMLRLLQPVESSWKTLAAFLLIDDYKIANIEAECFHDSASENALRDALVKWRQSTVQANRTWQTLCAAARKCKDKSLESYITEKGLQSEIYFT